VCKMRFYVLRLKICGIKNIENPVEFEFYKKTIANDFEPDKFKVQVIYGENGSGKTAVVTSVKLMQNLLIDKNYLADLDTQKKLSEIINKKTRESVIECDIYVDAGEGSFTMRYYIRLRLEEDERVCIAEESLKVRKGRYSKNLFSQIYKTEDGVLKQYAHCGIYQEIKEKTLNLLDKQTLVSRSLDYFALYLNSEQVVEAFFYSLTLQIFAITNLNVSLDDSDSHYGFVLREKLRRIEESYKESGNHELILHMQNAVTEIEGVESLVAKDIFSRYEKKVDRLCDFVKLFKPELKGIEIEKKDDGRYYRCRLNMVYEGYSLDREFESKGIKKIMDLYDCLDAAGDGHVVFIDELDANISDVYLGKLIEYFCYYGKGQLCFTAHNLSPMAILKDRKEAIHFISSINTVHTWKRNGNLTPENAYKNGFIEDSPFNVEASDFLGVLGGDDE